MTDLSVQCDACGLEVVFTDIRDSGYSYCVAGTLASLCPVIRKREEAGIQYDQAKEFDCPNLQRAVQRGLEEFHRSHQ